MKSEPLSEDDDLYQDIDIHPGEQTETKVDTACEVSLTTELISPDKNIDEEFRDESFNNALKGATVASHEQYSGSESENSTDGRSRRPKRKSSCGGEGKSQDNDNLNVADLIPRKIRTVTSGDAVRSPDDDDLPEEAERMLYYKDLFKGARFFMIKSRNDHNVQLAKKLNVWSTTPNNEPRLNKAFRNTRSVMLLFSVTESQRFAGFARLASESDCDVECPPWQLPPGMSTRALSGVFKIDWVSKEELFFTHTSHLHNEWNMGKPVKIGRDGQEIEPSVGEKTCRLFAASPGLDLYPVVKRMRGQEKKRLARLEGSSKGESSRGDAISPDEYRPPPPPKHIYTREHLSRNRDGRNRSRSPHRRDSERGGHRRDSGQDSGYRTRARSPNTQYSSSRGGRDRHDDRGRRGRGGSPRRDGRSPVSPRSSTDPVSRETLLHGSYTDYMREFQKELARQGWPGFPAAAAAGGAGAPPGQFPFMPFFPPPSFSSVGSSRGKSDVDTHAKLVDKFLKKTRGDDSDSGSSDSDDSFSDSVSSRSRSRSPVASSRKR